MAHEVETMAWAHKVPWHGLGVEVGPDTSPADMLVKAGLDWRVEKRELAYLEPEDDEDRRYGDRRHNPVPGHKALVRSSDGKVFDVVSDRWEPVQNADLLEFFRSYCEAGAAEMETAGALKGGEIVWALANLRHGFTLPGGDAVKGYLLMAGRHRSGFATIARVTPVRVVCANTLALAGGFGKAGALEARFHHTSEFDPERAREALGLAHEGVSEFERNARTLMGLRLSREDAVRVLAPIYQPGLVADHPANSRDEIEAGDGLPILADDWEEKANRTVRGIMEAALNGPGADVVGETAWGLLNGVTYYANHKSRGTADSRFASAIAGDSNYRANKVLTSLLALA